LNDWESFDGATSASARAHRARIGADPENEGDYRNFSTPSGDGSQEY